MQWHYSGWNNPAISVTERLLCRCLPRLMVAGSWDRSLQVTLQVADHRRSHAVAGFCPRHFLLPEGLTHRWASLYRNPVRGQAMGRPAVDVNHPYLSHAVRGRGRGFGTQSWQLAVSGLLPVQGGVIDGVGGAGPAVGARGTNRGTMESSQSMFGTLKSWVRVCSVGTCHAQSPLLKQVRVCIQALISPGESEAFTAHVLIRFDVPSLQDGAGTGWVSTRGGVGGGHPLPGDSGATRCRALPGTERDSGGRRRHGARGHRYRSLNGVVKCWADGGLSQSVGIITTGVQHLAVHLKKDKSTFK